MAFWEYVLLLEICYKILEKDREQHKRDHQLLSLIENLQNSTMQKAMKLKVTFRRGWDL